MRKRRQRIDNKEWMFRIGKLNDIGDTALPFARVVGIRDVAISRCLPIRAVWLIGNEDACGHFKF
jgi:hypothetical protein